MFGIVIKNPQDSGSLAIDTKNTLFVSKGGDDVAALAAGKYDLAQHWKNPTVAMAAAEAGDSVYVFGGEYTIGAGGAVGTFSISGTNGQIDAVGLVITPPFNTLITSGTIPFNTSIDQTAQDLVDNINSTATFPDTNAQIISSVAGVVTIQVTTDDSTLGATFASSVSGFPGDFDIIPLTAMVSNQAGVNDDGLQQMVKDGVTLHMMAGATINYTNLTGTASLPFTDGGVASTFLIRGDGRFIFNRDISGNDSWLVTENEGSIVDWEFDSIDIRRRFGDSSNDFSSWRMKGRRWENRESMLFAFRFPTGNTDTKFIDLDIEEIVIGSENANNQWNRQEIRNLNGNSVANIKYGSVTYPHGFAGGGFHQTTNVGVVTGNDATINISIGNFTREGLNNAISDYIIRTVSNGSGGQVSVLNIDTHTGLEFHTGAVGVPSTKKTSRFEGRIRNGYTGGTLFLQAILFSGISHQVYLNIDCESTAVTYLGIRSSLSPNMIYSGSLIWRNTVGSPIGIDAVTPLLKDLTVTISNVVIPVVANTTVLPVDIRVQNCYATTAVGPLINQLIETFNVDINV